jgi:hypothetical protein
MSNRPVPVPSARRSTGSTRVPVRWAMKSPGTMLDRPQRENGPAGKTRSRPRTSLANDTLGDPQSAESAHLPDDRIRLPGMRPRRECFGDIAIVPTLQDARRTALLVSPDSEHEVAPSSA